MPPATPNLLIAAMVSPPPAMEYALEAAMARAIASVPRANWAISNTPTGPFQTMVPPRPRVAASAAALVRPLLGIMAAAAAPPPALTSPRPPAESFLATPTSLGKGDLVRL